MPPARNVLSLKYKQVALLRAGRKAVARLPACGQENGQTSLYAVICPQHQASARDDDRPPQETTRKADDVFNSPRRRDYQNYRTGNSDQAGSSSMSILIGAGLIAAAILLSTLISALGGRYVGLESPAEDTAWLVDRLTGRVYKCQAAELGRAVCKADTATGSISDKSKP